MKLPNLTFKVKFPDLPEFGVQARYKHWSVICGEGSYGHKEGLYEVLGPGFGNEDDNVEGHLTLQEVLERIAKYEEENPCES